MLGVYAIKDAKGGFGQPLVFITDGAAVRQVKSWVNTPGKDLMSQYPEDFELWLIGQFDQDSGILVPVDLKFIVRCAALKDEAV